MKTKKCSKCGVEKELNLFGCNKRCNDGRNSQCKECDRKRKKEYYKNNKEKHNNRTKKYYQNNRDSILEHQKEYYQNNKDIISVKQQEYYQNNKEEISKRKREYERDRYSNDIEYRLTYIIRRRLRNAVRNFSIDKKMSTIEYLGCTISELMIHLQQTAVDNGYTDFDIYSYDSNEYHIDHIKTFEDVGKGLYTLEEVCHYSNLQILTSNDNLKKGGNSW